MKDVTERTPPEAELHQAQQLLRIATRVGQIGGWEVDLATGTVSWSDEVCAIHGVPAGFRPRVDRAIEFYAPEYRDVIRAAVERCVADGTPYDLELQIFNAAGERVWVRTIGEAELDGEGAVTRIRGAFQNITERKAAMEALHDSEERFRLAARATSDVIWDWYVGPDVCYWTEGLRTQFGYEDIGPHPASFWIDRVHPDDRDRVFTTFHSDLESHKVWVAEYRFLHAEGRYLTVVDRAYAAVSHEGRPQRVVGAMLDVTQARATEAELEQVKRVASLGQLAAGMAHEFNNVLMSIQPFAELIRRRVPDDPRVLEMVNSIQQAVRRGRNVTDEILRFTRRIDLRKQPIPVAEWISGFRGEAEVLVAGRVGLDLHTDDAVGLTIEGDLAQLNQVLANLVLNARDASHAGQTVSLRARRSPIFLGEGATTPAARISVEDRGCGIDAAVLGRIFDPLYTTKKNGTGLGLAICHRIVAAHGGRITPESIVGRGTTFHVDLPLLDSTGHTSP